MTAALLAFLGVVGLMIGSFLNVVVARVPAGESIVRPRSRCPRCGAQIRERDNVPVVSWLLLRGRCRDCGEPISVRYPVVELLTAGLFVGLGAKFGAVAVLPAYLYLAAVGVALAFIDLDTKRLPNALTLPSYPVAVVLLGAAALADNGHTPFVRALFGGLVMFGAYFLLVLVYPAGMGLGDVKLSGVLGLYLGWLGWGVLAVGFFVAFFVGAIVGVVLMVAQRAGRKTAIPFGPFMVLGALVAVFAGQPIADLWLHTGGV